MIDQIQLQKLIDLPIEGVAERLGLDVARHKCHCPFHEDKRPSLTFNRSKNNYRCYACGAYGRTIDLVMHQLGKTFPDACQWLADEHNMIISSEPTTCASASHESPASFSPSKYLRFFDRPYLSPAARAFLFDERHLDPRIISWCKLSSWRDKWGINWLQIPYFDTDGNLIGIQNRNLDYGKPNSCPSQTTDYEVPRFRFPKGSRCSIYNLQVLKTLKDGEPLFITEGASDCWSMLSSGHKAIAIPSATLLKPNELTAIRMSIDKTHSSLHMYPDQDAPGESLFAQLKECFPQLTHHQLPAGCKDFSDFYVRNVKRKV